MLQNISWIFIKLVGNVWIKKLMLQRHFTVCIFLWIFQNFQCSYSIELSLAAVPTIDSGEFEKARYIICAKRIALLSLRLEGEETLKYRCVYMLLSCHIRLSDWIYTLDLPECQGTPCSKQLRYLKFKWQQRESNPQSLSSQRKLNHLAKLAKWSNVKYSLIEFSFKTKWLWLWIPLLSLKPLCLSPFEKN